MPFLFKIEPVRTYATEANAIAAVNKAFAGDVKGQPILRYFIHRSEDGRFFPVFVGQAAMQAGAHLKFNVIG